MIVQNQPCPACQEMGRDKTGNHLMLFDDGNMVCNRKHLHKNGEVFFVPTGSDNPILGMEISGKIKYTVEHFKELLESGKLTSPAVREIALSGMRGQDRWEASNEEERTRMLECRDYDLQYFEQLKVRNLKSRHIRGDIAKFYNVRTGMDESGRIVDRHYYPVYSKEDGQLRGAKCRMLPKDFSKGTLGWTWGSTMLAGQQTLATVLDEGGRMDTLLLVGGECDMMAGQQMLFDARQGTNFASIHAHVWSPTKGECALSEIMDNKETIGKFKKIILAFDNDETGKKLTNDVARLFRDKAFKIQWPDGCKDVNDCLKQGREKEFVDSWFNPASPFEGGNIRRMSHYRDKALEVIEDGLSYPWPDLNKTSYGIRPYTLSVWGGGSGCGKTTVTKEIVFHLAYQHNKNVMVVYLEDQPDKVLRSFAGYLIGKDLAAPACSDKRDPDYTVMRDYTVEQATAAINQLCEDNKIFIGDLEGRKDVDSVMAVIEEGIIMGYEYFVVDNLTAFEHSGKNGKMVNKVEAIDETMRRLGTAKDENPIHIMVLSHLNRDKDNPHEEGGEVGMHHFRGAQSITFWANAIYSIERNTKAEKLAERCLTTLRCCKSRDAGHNTGSCAYALKSMETGKLQQVSAPAAHKKDKPEKRKDFDTGEEY